MRYLEAVSTKAGSTAFGIDIEYPITVPQYTGLNEVSEEAPDGASLEDIALVNLNSALKAHSTQGNKGGVRDALDVYFKTLEASEIETLQGMSVEDRSVILVEVEGVAKAIAAHQEKCPATRLSASVQRGRSDGLTTTEVNKMFAAEAKHLSREQVEEQIAAMRALRNQG